MYSLIKYFILNNLTLNSSDGSNIIQLDFVIISDKYVRLLNLIREFICEDKIFFVFQVTF